MKKALILLLFFFSTQGFTTSNTNTKVKVSNVNEKIHYSGNWMESNGGASQICGFAVHFEAGLMK